jgi:hypothetical protein
MILPVSRWYAPGPTSPTRSAASRARPAVGRRLSRRCHITVITDVIMGAEYGKTMMVVTG